jgi:hypothetical protein
MTSISAPEEYARLLREFTDNYIECMLWAESGDPDSPLGEQADRDEIDTKSLDQITSDCNDFLADPITLVFVVNKGPEQCGHDFWLTRNGHGAGFWDRGWGAVGEYLTARSKAAGDCDVYRGDDGLIYIMGAE